MKISGAPVIITIDGPAASGKTSVSREVAKRFGWNWVSTGAFYRGLALVAQKAKINTDKESEIIHLVNSDRWAVKMNDAQTQVFYEGQEVTRELAHESVGMLASKISQLPHVREQLLQPQRNCAVGVKGLVAEGRDCGTVVFPQAHVKIYLTAHSGQRAQRRALEQGEKVENILNQQLSRDHADSQRTVAPMQVPTGAHVVDTTQMDFSQVVDHIEGLIRQELKI